MAVLALLASARGGDPVAACPNCKEAVAAQPGEVAAMARGYNWSVLLMLSMPFTLLGTGAFVVVRAVAAGLPARDVSRRPTAVEPSRSEPARVGVARQVVGHLAGRPPRSARCQSAPKRANSGRL